MDYFKQIRCFWDANRSQRFTTSEIALYFFLLEEANRNFWRMPFACETAIVCATLRIPKSTLTRSRDGLRAKGFIAFTEGVQHSRAPTYEIIPKDMACETAHATISATDNTTADSTTGTTSIENINKENSHLSARKNIDELEKILVADIEYQQLVIKELSASSITQPPELIPYIHKFFNSLRISNTREKEESDTRKHFFNWMKKEFLNIHINKQQRHDCKRIIEVTATSAQAFDSSF